MVNRLHPAASLGGKIFAKARKFIFPRLWMVALALTVLFLAIDSWVHLRATWEITAKQPNGPLATDASTPSGFVGNQHELILPYAGIDTYPWVMQTQLMLAKADVRVREVDYDNAPDGREVHWSSSMRWWLAGLAWLDHAYRGTPLPQAVEEVAPFAGTLLVVLLVGLVTPFVARRFGSGSASLFVIGVVAIAPFYQSYSAGKSDHHGLAALSALLTILFLVGGAAGWVRQEPTGGGSDDLSLLAWLPDRRQARRWFIASGVVGGMGLWISTASEAPVLTEIGIGALLATGWLGRGSLKTDPAQPEPSLWRMWGWAGASTSIFFYLLEYFPSHLGWRLEVNHPLYALAWAGGGELIFRVCRWWNGGKLAGSVRDGGWIAFGLVAIAAPVLAVAFFSGQVFWVADPFLFNLHQDYIEEFKNITFFLGPRFESPGAKYLAAIVNPVFLLGLPMLAWSCRRSRKALLGALAIALPVYDCFLSTRSDYQLAHYFWPLLVLPAVIIVALLGLGEPWPEFPRPARALLLLTLPPGLVTFLLSLQQMRWMEISYALWLAALIAAVLALGQHHDYRWTVVRKVGAAIFLAGVLLPEPILTVQDWLDWNWVAPTSDFDIRELTVRDISQRLRARLGRDPGVVVNGPSSTTGMTYWGGCNGLGTYYWENLAGLKADQALYSAHTANEVLALIKQHHVTHLVTFSWEPAYPQFMRLANDRRVPTTAAEAEAEKPLMRQSYIANLIAGRQIPPWLRVVSYPLPGDKVLAGQYVVIFEVAFEQTPEEATVRLAQAQLAAGNQDAALASLTTALKIKPDYLPALLRFARIDSFRNQPELFSNLIRKILGMMPQAGSLALEDRLELAILLFVVNERDEAKVQAAACLNLATAQNLRHLSDEERYNFLALLRQCGLAEARPGLRPFVLNLLPENLRKQYRDESARAATTK